MRPYNDCENVRNIQPKFCPETASVPLEEPVPCGIRAAIARLKARTETNQDYLVRINNVLNGFPREYFEKKCEEDKSPDDVCSIMTLLEDIDRVLLENRAILGSIYSALGINESQYGFTDPFEN